MRQTRDLARVGWRGARCREGLCKKPIPVVWYPRLDVFNGASFISLNTQSPHAAARQVVRMLQRTEEWVELAKKPAVTDAQFAKHFSWHWSVWRTHGDYLRTRIVRFLLGACDASTDSAPFAEAPCKIPTPTVQIPFLSAETGAKGQGLQLLPWLAVAPRS